MGRGDDEILGNNNIGDVRWLCSLSESELDFLISLKMLVIQRAKSKSIGHDALSNKFDLRMLRALGFVLMEYLKEQLKEMPVIPGLTNSSSFLDGSNLLKHNLNDSFGSMSIEELKAFICSDQRKRIADMFSDDMAPHQKKKTETGRPL